MNKISKIALAAFAVALLPAAALAQTADKDGTTTTAVHEAAGAGVVLNSGDYYGSGFDDAFAEYGVTTFNFSAADFGGAITGVLSATLSLTVNDRSFADGTQVQFHYTPDDASDLDNGGGDFSALSYDAAFSPQGVNPGHYVNGPVSLGVFNILPTDAGRAGEVDTFSLDLSGIEASLVNEINTGSDFQIIITAVNDADDITYSGVGNTFDPGDPNLEINAVPEPATMVALGLGAAALLRRRRK